MNYQIEAHNLSIDISNLGNVKAYKLFVAQQFLKDLKNPSNKLRSLNNSPSTLHAGIIVDQLKQTEAPRLTLVIDPGITNTLMKKEMTSSLEVKKDKTLINIIAIKKLKDILLEGYGSRVSLIVANDYALHSYLKKNKKSPIVFISATFSETKSGVSLYGSNDILDQVKIDGLSLNNSPITRGGQDLLTSKFKIPSVSLELDSYVYHGEVALSEKDISIFKKTLDHLLLNVRYSPVKVLSKRKSIKLGKHVNNILKKDNIHLSYGMYFFDTIGYNSFYLDELATVLREARPTKKKFDFSKKQSMRLAKEVVASLVKSKEFKKIAKNEYRLITKGF